MKAERNLSIELLKFFAVMLVANSHMDVLYGKYSVMATGGAIGDALFFFASGFTIFLGRFGKFANWYKRRIKRIYPSIFAWATIMSFMDLRQLTISQLIMATGCWFISCIMLYYVFIWFVRKFSEDKLFWPFFISIFFILVWYCFEDSSKMFMYGNTYFKWMYNFLFMLAGAYVGSNKIMFKYIPLTDGIKLLSSIVFFYLLKIMAEKEELFAHLQILTVIPLMGIVIYMFKLCSLKKVDDLMKNKIGLCLRFIAGLCLEAYIVQTFLIPILAERISTLFPFNLLITLFIILFAAYMTRCLARIISQLFEKDDMDWKAIFRLIN